MIRSIPLCLLCCLSLSSFGQTVSILYENEGPDEPRTPASQILVEDNQLFVGTGGRRVLEYDAGGDLLGTIIELLGEDVGTWTNLYIENGHFIGHGGEAGYNIFVSEHTIDGSQLTYANVTSGQSGAGELIDVNGDWHLLWASNCCGTGQTWDTELKKFNGHSDEVVWNTDLCYECNNWAGGCSHGQDYPMDLEFFDNHLYAFKANVTSPCYGQIGVQKIDLTGELEWSFEYPGQRFVVETIVLNDEMFVLGYSGESPNRQPFLWNVNAEGEVVWEHEFLTDFSDMEPIDLVADSNGNLRIGLIENGGFRLDEISPLTSEQVSTFSIPIQREIKSFELYGSNLLQLGMNDFVLAYNWGNWYDDSRFSLVRFSLGPTTGCTDPLSCNYNQEATDDDGSCEFLSCVGCLNYLACNYDVDATQPGSCDFPDEECEECVDGVVTAIDIDNDGVADCGELAGCTDSAACNFMPAATEDDGSCVMQPQEIWQGEQLFSMEEELALFVPGSDHVIWSDDMTENPLVVAESGTYGFTMVNGDLNEMSQSVSAGPESCGLIEAGSYWKAGQFTVGLWLKLDNSNRGYILMEGDDGWPDDFGLALQCIDGFIELDVNHLNLGLTSVNLNDSHWHAVHVMYNGSAIQLYIDGALNMDVPFEDDIAQNDWPFVLGSKKSYECTTNDGSGSVFEGSLSRLSIWSRTLEPWELSESIACGERFVGESLVGHWPLNGSGASGELVALAGEAGVNHDMAVVEDSPVGSCSRCVSSDWVEVVLATDLCGEGAVWDASVMTCVVANPSDTDFDGCVGMIDLLDLLSVFGTCAESESEVVVWSCGDHVSYQGYDYATVQIGEQCWFAENLRSENYDNGDPIASNLSDGEWESTDEGAVAVYGEDLGCSNYSPEVDSCNPVASLDAFGRLYNWFAVEDARSLCPSGWHVPSDNEWMEFELWLGMSEEAANDVGYRGTDEGLKLKSTTGWYGGGDGSNVIGFNALSGGYRSPDGVFDNAGYNAFWWNSSSVGENSGFRYLDHAYDKINRNFIDPRYGCAMRCLQDSE